MSQVSSGSRVQGSSNDAIPAGMQIVEVIDPMVRQDRLDALLKKYHASRKNRVLVFVLYKKEASRIETFLQRRGWKVSPMANPLQC